MIDAAISAPDNAARLFKEQRTRRMIPWQRALKQSNVAHAEDKLWRLIARTARDWRDGQLPGCARLNMPALFGRHEPSGKRSDGQCCASFTRLHKLMINEIGRAHV